MDRALVLAALLLAGCSQSPNPDGEGLATPVQVASTMAAAASLPAERPLPAGVTVVGPELGCGSRCPEVLAAVQAELEREAPGYPPVSSLRLYRQSIVSAADPQILCDHSVDLLVAIAEAPGRPDTPVAVFYDATANVRATPWVPC